MRSRALAVVVLAVGLVLVSSTGGLPASGARPPVLPVATYGGFVTNLSMPTLTPGSSGPVSFSVSDPLAVALTQVHLTLAAYAFNAYPGNATGPVPGGGAPVFSGATTSSNGTVSISVGTLTPGGVAFASPGAVDLVVAAPSGAPDGDYAIRIGLTFDAIGTGYVLESRGFFSTAQWQNATGPTSAGSTLNVTRLGVSGILPESAVLVRTNPFPTVLAVVLAGSVALAGLGGYWALRRGPGSRSGTTVGRPPRNAETALGNSRNSDGD